MIKHYQILPRTKLLLLLLFFISTQAWSQTRTITGKLTSTDDGTSLPGANIIEKGTTNGTVSDANGDYTMVIKEGATLVISFIGYISQEVVVQNQNVVNINLSPDVALLGEVVLVGYGEMEKEDVTGAIVSVSTKDFNKGVMTSPQDLLVGKVAGVQITSGSGSPTSSSTIRIRGGSSLPQGTSNDPLIIIDGFPVDNESVGGVGNPLAAINPGDIESYTVLKDASATAIYGSRASNGVIIITTKKGKKGKPEFSYNGSVSLSTPIKYYDVLSADEYRALVTKAAEDGKISSDAPSLLGTSNTNWQKEIYRNAISNDHNLTISGTTKKLPYRLSYGYTNQQGMLRNTDMQRQSLNINVNPSFFDDHLKITASAKGSYTNSNFGNDGAVGAAISFDPTQPVRDANTDWGGYFTWRKAGNPIDIATSNPVALIEQTDNRSKAKRMIGNLQAEYKLPFFPALKLNVNGGFDITKSDGFDNAPSNAAFTYRSGTGRIKDYNQKHHSELLDLYLNYTKEIGGHKVNFTGGYSWQHFERHEYDSTRNAAGTNGSRNIFANENYLISFFGRLNYVFKEKYLLTATLRDDGSSRFSKENRWGLFPSASVAWRISEESFLSDSRIVSNLKLRAGYGFTGQQDVSTGGRSGKYYPSLATYTVSKPSAQYQLGNTFYQSYRPNPYDYNLKWETTSTLNIGLDFGLVRDRVYGSIEVYQRQTKDLIMEIFPPLGTGFSNRVTTNVGTLENNGIEITLNAVPIAKGNLTWNVGFNFTHNVNKITKINQTGAPSTGYNTEIVGSGNHIRNININTSATSFHVFEQVYAESGKPIEGLYIDQTGNGGSVVSSDLNRIRYKQSAPTAFMGINSRVNYKKLDFSFSGRFSFGNYVYNNNWATRATYSAVYNSAGYLSNTPSAIKDAEFLQTQPASNYYIQDASFFKMDNISAGYNLDNVFTKNLKARIGFTVRNAFIVTKYKGLDPEVENGIDSGFYPRPRVFVFSLSLTL
jgi:TonB-linked SusC/RagA family outer membrane protein